MYIYYYYHTAHLFYTYHRQSYILLDHTDIRKCSGKAHALCSFHIVFSAALLLGWNDGSMNLVTMEWWECNSYWSVAGQQAKFLDVLCSKTNKTHKWMLRKWIASTDYYGNSFGYRHSERECQNYYSFYCNILPRVICNMHIQYEPLVNGCFCYWCFHFKRICYTEQHKYSC
jgi:hypothetical protein